MQRERLGAKERPAINLTQSREIILSCRRLRILYSSHVYKAEALYGYSDEIEVTTIAIDKHILRGERVNIAFCSRPTHRLRVKV